MNIALNQRHLLDSRPVWLERLDQTQRNTYFDQQRASEATDARLEELLAPFGSLQNFARQRGKEILRFKFGLELDPDEILCNSRYSFMVGGRQVVQEESRSLTEQMIAGVHDEGHRAEFSFKGRDLPANLNQPWLEATLSFDGQWAHSAELGRLFLRAEVIAAMKNALREKLLLTALAARHQGHISNDEHLARIQRAVTGDSAFVIDGIRFLHNTRPLAQMLVIGARKGDGEFMFLYAPGSPGDQTWYECRSLRQVDSTVIEWTQKQAGRDFIASRAHALNRVQIVGYLKGLEQMPTLWRGITLATTPHMGDQVLNGIVENARAWRISEEESVRPYGFRNAPMPQRQSFARINCELRALQTLAAREGGFISYERFCFDLIKQRVEQVLREKGEQVAVNPDRILVDVSPDAHMTLTRLIVTETHFYANDAGSAWSYPRFTLAQDHPAVKNLDIRHIAGWSRTLRPGEKYIAMLRAKYLDRTHAEGVLKRLVHKQVARRQMQIGVLQEHFHGRLQTAQFKELMRIIDASENVDNRSVFTVALDDPGLFHLQIRNRLVVGVFVLRCVNEGKVESYLFTPDAPDGRWIRPFSEFVSSVKSLGLGQYFYQRVAYKDQRVVGTYITDLEQLSNFTEMPVIQQYARVTDFSGDFDGLIARTVSDVDEKTESLNEIMFKLVFNAVEAAATVISVVVPPVGIAMSVVLLTKSLWEAAEAYQDGDRATAQVHFLSALVELASLGKAGISKLRPTKLQKDVIGLLGDIYSIEKFFSQATGQKRLPLQALAIIQSVLDDPESFTSKTYLR
ncbi:hypothetical protein N8H74_15395 [Pseudomonas sp. B2M1-30]|uniref:dermonecrotic toxin domain-containing protein n=1 Tax=Pseudomonas TaxID=286 RepID=UPI0021C7C22E|nr:MULTISPECIES: DUF6543 domain-containing protein [Pseudomonas]MCU0119648.1 hypothetical protein [Pseudomonas sp. B2M1-30]MCU7261856.1 hypothetical protein [Pseudomonas koreensis]